MVPKTTTISGRLQSNQGLETASAAASRTGAPDGRTRRQHKLDHQIRNSRFNQESRDKHIVATRTRRPGSDDRRANLLMWAAASEMREQQRTAAPLQCRD